MWDRDAWVPVLSLARPRMEQWIRRNLVAAQALFSPSARRDGKAVD